MPRRARPSLPVIAIGALFLLAAIAWLWPLPAHLSTHVAKAPYWWDAELNVFILAEAGHNLLHPQGHLLDARIFHPHANVLAYSESLLFPALVSLPLRPFLSPWALHNLLIVLGVALSGLAMALYLHRRVALLPAVFGGVLFAFAPFRLGELSRLQLVSTELLPCILLALEAALSRPRFPRWLAFFALGFAQALTSLYYAFHLAVLLPPVAASAMVRLRGRWTRRALASAFAALLLVAIPAALLLAPYWSNARRLGLTRDEGWLSATSGRLDYLVSASELQAHWKPLARHVIESIGYEPIGFPGGLAVLFAAIGVAAAAARPFRRARAASPVIAPEPRAVGDPPLFGVGTHLVWLALALLFFFGTSQHAPFGAWPYEVIRHVPGAEGLRYPSRFMVFGQLSLCALASFGANAVLGLVERGSRPVATGCGAALCALAATELWTVSLPLRAVPQAGPAARFLAHDPDARALLELPLNPNDHPLRAEADDAVLAHGLPTLNGFSGYEPRAWPLFVEALAKFPDARSHALLRALGINRVRVRAAGGPLSPEALATTPWLREVYGDAVDRVYAVTDVDPDQPRRIRAAVRGFVPATDVRGLPPQDLHAEGGANPAGLPMLFDGNPETRWASEAPQRPEQVWFELAFDEPRSISRIWLDARRTIDDLPRGLRVEGLDARGEWRVLADEPWPCLLPLMAAPAQSLCAVELTATPATRLRLIGTGSSPKWVSLGGLTVQP